MRQFKRSELPPLRERRDRNGETYLQGLEVFNPHDRAIIMFNEHPLAYTEDLSVQRILVPPKGTKIIPHRQYRIQFEDGSDVPVINWQGQRGNLVVNTGHAAGQGITGPKDYHHGWFARLYKGDREE